MLPLVLKACSSSGGSLSSLSVLLRLSLSLSFLFDPLYGFTDDFLTVIPSCPSFSAPCGPCRSLALSLHCLCVEKDPYVGLAQTIAHPNSALIEVSLSGNVVNDAQLSVIALKGI